MSLPLGRPYPPMEARSVDALPPSPGWQYEPKWDGFRCLAFRDGGEVALQSKAGASLTRYFPEMVAALKKIGARRFVLDGELVVPKGRSLSFDDLLRRIHPAESRVKKLAAETPALLIVFDLLVDERGTSRVEEPLSARRPRLEAFAGRYLEGSASIVLSPATRTRADALRWLKTARGALDGVIAKRMDAPYRSGARDGMVKIKRRRTAECVVGGFRYASKGRAVGSLLLGLYDEKGLLHHVGYTSSQPEAERRELVPKLKHLIHPPGFTGNAPGGPSRWSTKRSMEWQPLRPVLVVEVEYDQVSGYRFRHGTRFLRYRTDKPPQVCTFDQIRQVNGNLLTLLRKGRSPARQGRASGLTT